MPRVGTRMVSEYPASAVYIVDAAMAIAYYVHLLNNIMR